MGKDVTVVLEEDPILILLADDRVDKAPYLGFYPPGSTSSHELVIIDNELETIENAIQWPIWKDTVKPAELDASAARPFAVVDLEDKGTGMIATRDISAGELIHKERLVCMQKISCN